MREYTVTDGYSWLCFKRHGATRDRHSLPTPRSRYRERERERDKERKKERKGERQRQTERDSESERCRDTERECTLPGNYQHTVKIDVVKCLQCGCGCLTDVCVCLQGGSVESGVAGVN